MLPRCADPAGFGADCGEVEAAPDTGLDIGVGEDLDACRRLLRGGSRTFLAASRLLPREVADAACALYAFCRIADDRIDGAGACDARDLALDELRRRLDLIYAGKPLPFAADRAFASVVARYGLPKAWPRALLEGFEWDASGRQYEELPALRAYAARVAGSVGAMMASVLGARGRDALGRACELGIAMQLTNIARDVGEDARLGRLYLPRSWMREVGIDPERWLQQPAFTPALAIVIRRLLDEADTRYRAAAGAIEALPFACRPGIRAAAALYRDIGRSIERAGFDSVGTRAVVGRARKAAVLSIAIFGAETGPRAATCSAPGEVDFLLDPAPPHPARGRSARSGENSPAPSGMVGLLQIFEKLERRDRMRSAVLAAPARPGLET